MPITKSAVEHVAHLAKIYLEPLNIDKYTHDLSEILDLVEQMESIATHGIEPLAHPQDIELRLRPDRVTEASARERLQTTAPDVERGLYLVPKIIE